MALALPRAAWSTGYWGARPSATEVSAALVLPSASPRNRLAEDATPACRPARPVLHSGHESGKGAMGSR